MSKRLFKDSVITGLALFAMFFGAGNLVFPPSIGLVSGEAWVIGVLGLLLSAIILPVTAVWSVNNAGGDARALVYHVHPRAFMIASVVGWIFCGIGSTLPRTAAVTHEIGVHSLFPSIPIGVTVAIFFVIVFLLARTELSVVDKLGKYLTPILIAILAVVLIKGVIMPIGTPVAPSIDNPFSNAMFQGYVIGDLTIGVMSANIFIFAIRSKGYPRSEEKRGIYLAGIVCVVVMFAIYGTMAYLGATAGSIFPTDTQQAPLLVGIVNAILGPVGTTCLAIIVLLACLTTAVAISTSIARFFCDLFHNKISYQIILLVICVISALLGTSGVTNIINYVMPISMTMYPPFIVAVFLGLMDHFLPNDGVYKGGVYVALLFGFFDGLLVVFPGFTALARFVSIIPFGSAGFGWLVPTAIGMVIGGILYRGKPRKYYIEPSEPAENT